MQLQDCGTSSFKENSCEQPPCPDSNSSGACPGWPAPHTAQCPDPGQASHAYCVFFHRHKSLLIPSKPFLVSIKAQLPPCFSWRGLVQPHGAGTVTERRQSRTGWPCLCTGVSPHPCAPALIPWLIQAHHKLGVGLPQRLLSQCYQLFSHPLLVFYPIQITIPLCPVNPCPCPKFLSSICQKASHISGVLQAQECIDLSRRPLCLEELVMHLQAEYTHAWAALGCAGRTENIPGCAVPHTSLAHGKSSAGCCSPWQLPLKHSSCTTCVALPVSSSADRSP